MLAVLHPRFDLAFSPSIELVSVVRRFVSSFFDRVLGDNDLVSRLARATHELLENAVKYGTEGGTRLYIGLEDEQMVTIRLENRAKPEDIVRLVRTLEEMSASNDANAYYQEVMRR